MRPRVSPPLVAVVVALAALASLPFIASGPNPPEAVQALGGGATASSGPKQTENPKLHAMLPAKNRKSGKLVSVNNGSFPPYEIVGTDGHQLSGASADMAVALGQVLGVRVENVTVDGLPSTLTGIQAGRYDLALGPVGDFADREKTVDFVDWVQEFVVFAVPKGNPKRIGSLADTCGLRISVMAGGSAEDVIKKQATRCRDAGKKPVRVQSYKDQPSSILAVRSGRADGFFSSQAPLTYFVQQSKGQLELAGTGEKNGFTNLYQGAVVPNDNSLGKALRLAFAELMRNGTYDRIMKKWGLAANRLDAPGINLGRNTPGG